MYGVLLGILWLNGAHLHTHSLTNAQQHFAYEPLWLSDLLDLKLNKTMATASHIDLSKINKWHAVCTCDGEEWWGVQQQKYQIEHTKSQNEPSAINFAEKIPIFRLFLNEKKKNFKSKYSMRV